MTIIGISGQINSGKTTLAQYICEKYGYEKASFAAPLKDACMQLFGFTKDQLHTQKGKETKDEYWGITPREALQYIGTDIVRKQMNNLIKDIGPDFWIKRFEKTYSKKKLIVIDDIRFQNEVEIIRKLGGYVIKIDRGNILNKHNHESENSLKDIDFGKYVILNNGTKEDLFSSFEKLKKK